MIFPVFGLGLPSGGEWFYILLVVLLLFGPKKLPDLARSIGKSIGEFRKAKTDFEREVNAAASDDPKSGQLEAPKK
jgi:TatA/E family protein of Tat protein translocase